MTRNNLIGAFALLAVLSLGATNVFASEVTGTLSSNGVTSSNSGTTGTIGGTVSPAPQSAGGGGGGGGGGNPLTLGVTNANAAGSGSVAGASSATGFPQGQVLGTSAGQTVGGGSSVSGTVTPEEPPLLASTQGTGNSTGNVLGATAASGVDMGMWLWWLLILVIAAAIGYYFYQRTKHERKKGEVA